MANIYRSVGLAATIAIITGCTAPRAKPILLENEASATIVFNARFPDSELYFIAPLQCMPGAFGTQSYYRPAVHLVTEPRTRYASKKEPAKIPTGKDMAFGVTQERTAGYQWTMDVIPGATYYVTIKPVVDLVVFHSGLDFSVTKNGNEVPTKVFKRTKEIACPENQ